MSGYWFSFPTATATAAQVRHNMGEVAEGETVIVTLADKPLLDDRGNLRDDEDELENTLLVGSSGGGRE